MDSEEKISLLEAFYGEVELPPDGFVLSPCETITDVPKFVDAHFTFIWANQGEPVADPYIERLEKLKIKLNGDD